MPDDPNTPAGGATPPVAAAPPAAPQTPPAETISLTSDALKKRLDEASASAQRKYLKGLGFEKEEDLQAALKRLKDSDDASKTEQERLRSQLEELSPKAQRADALSSTLLELVNDQLKDLPEEARKLIDEEVGDDPEARLAIVKLARAMGVKIGAQPAATSTAPAVTPPVTTAPSPAPSPSGAPTKFQEWEAMRARSPGLGDIFYQTHQREIERTRPAN